MNSKHLLILIAIFFSSILKGQDCEIIELAIANISCKGYNDGKIVLSNTIYCASPVTYSWAHGASGNTINNLSPGLYELTMTDNTGYQIEKNWLITEPDEINIDASTYDITCNGQEDGSIYLSVYGGTYPYNYNWSNGSTDAYIFDAIAGNYSVTVTDANGCSSDATYTISEPDPVSINVDLFDNISCQGENDGHIIVSGIGGTTDSGTSPVDYYYEWSTGDFNVNEIDNFPPGLYSVTVSDFYLCSATMNFIVFNPSDIFVTFPIINDLICNGDGSGSIEINAGGGTGNLSYNWSNGATGNINENLESGNYSLTITDENGCTFTDSYFVNEPSAIVEFPADIVNLSCFENATGEIEVFFSGGSGNLSYQWSNGASTSDQQDLQAGTYDLTVTDANACTFTNTYVVYEPSEIIITNPLITDIDCFGNQNGSIEIFPAGGTPNYSYEWSNGSNSNIISGLAAGSYTLTITDANGCTYIETYNISEPSEIIITNPLITDIDCFGNQNGSIEIFPAGGTPNYSYEWSNGSNSNIISGLDAGSYTLTITDANGCTYIETYNISEPNEIIITNPLITDIDCFGNQNGSIEIFPAGGTPNYSYEWSNGSNSNIISGLDAGSYTLTITDSNGCTYIETYNISEPSEIIITNPLITDIDCFGNQNGSIEIFPAGGTPNYSYLWSNGSTSNIISGLTGGSYTLTITDANGCTFIETYTIIEPNEIVADAEIINVECGSENTGSISLSMNGGTGDFTFEWSTGGSSNSITNLASGSYSVIVTDATGCIFTETYFISQPGSIVINSVDKINNTCPEDESGKISIDANGGAGSLSFNWSNGSSTPTISNLSSGIYSVTISDENGCNIVDEYEISEPSNIVAEELIVDHVKCFNGEDGKISFSPSGGTAPFIVEWTYLPSNGSQPLIFESINVTNNVSYSFGSGTVNVKISDANLCTSELPTISIDQPEKLNYSSPIIEEVKCFGEATGLISFNINGGSSPYSVEWTYTPLGSNETFVEWTYNVIDSVNYQLPASVVMPIITDANGCILEIETLLINEPESIIYSDLEVISPSCSEEENGKVSFIINGGSSPYAVKWTYIPQGSNETFVEWTYNIVDSISYSFPSAIVTPTIVDAQGCQIEMETITISDTAPLEIKSLLTNDSQCYGDTSGLIAIELTGGLAPYTVEWTYTPFGSSDIIAEKEDSQSGVINKFFAAGIVDIIIADANGCEINVPTQTINVKNEITISQLDISEPKCGEDSSGIVTILMDGGSSPYAIEWTYTSSEGNETYVEWTYNITGVETFNFGSGILSAHIEDANGCVFQLDEFILENVDGTQIEEIKVTYTEGLGNIELILDTPADDLNFEWIGPDGFISSDQNLTELKQGIYSCIITDSNGCITLTGGVDIIITSINEINKSDFIKINTLANGILSVSNKLDRPIRLMCYDTNGQLLLRQPIHQGENTIDISELPSGLYVILIQDKKDTFSQLISKF